LVVISQFSAGSAAALAQRLPGHPALAADSWLQTVPAVLLAGLAGQAQPLAGLLSTADQAAALAVLATRLAQRLGGVLLRREVFWLLLGPVRPEMPARQTRAAVAVPLACIHR
jgi:hypothetical protein